jgi:hypothetical protein
VKAAGATGVATASRPPDTDADVSPAGRGQASPRQPRLSAEERNAAVRATLTPLAPGERPWPIKIAVLLAVLVGGGDLIDVIVGGQFTIGRTHASVAGVVLFSVLMLACAVGMWRLRYWAVLGFQAILGIVILIFSLYLIRASNLLGFLVAGAIVGLGGWLFYKLVRVLSRLQMPRYHGRE